jgi:sec-independent protein translocase protein TatC
VVAAVITPTPDPFNQTLVGLPLYLLYELGVLLARWAR